MYQRIRTGEQLCESVETLVNSDEDFPTVYKVNGSIYINAINEHFGSETSLNDNVLPYVMDRAYSVDIDSIEDLGRAERLMRQISKCAA